MGFPFATDAGTNGFRRRHEGDTAEGHFRLQQGLWMSSIGLGTYLGNHDNETDAQVERAVARCVNAGVNVIDTAINYRCQRGERAVGRALRDLFESGRARREELVIATKGGFLPFDGEPPSRGSDYFNRTFVQTGIVAAGEVVAGCHCLAPAYLRHQIERSRANLGLEAIDLYYLHNPETQLREIERDEFRRRLLAAFDTLERAVAAGKIRWYGTATWDAYRRPAHHRDSLSLEEVVALAVEAGGEQHHLRVIQLPLNLSLPEALTARNQTVRGDAMTAIEAAGRLGLTVMASGALNQGALTGPAARRVEGPVPGLETIAQQSLQFVRSAPGVSVALVGMKTPDHLDENLKVAMRPPLPVEQFRSLFKV